MERHGQGCFPRPDAEVELRHGYSSPQFAKRCPRPPPACTAFWIGAYGLKDHGEAGSEDLLSRLKGFVTGSRYGSPEQRSLLVQAVIAASKIMSDTRFQPHPDGARVTQFAPLRLLGPGTITIRGHLELGVTKAAHLFTGIFIAARTQASSVSFDDGCVLNNGVTIVSEGASIRFGKRVLAGANLFCTDSNFHNLAVERRASADPAPAAVTVGDDVLIGDGVKILKGCDIGAGSVIAAGAVLLPGFSCPPNSTVVGNPAAVRPRSRGTASDLDIA